MTSAFTSINLSQVPAPNIVEALSFEEIFAAMLADLRARYPAFTALVESDPLYKGLEVCDYRELLLRQRVNDASKALMLAFALGADLDQIGATFGVARLLITPADDDALPPVAAVYETDEDFRRRIQLSFEGYTTAGSEGSYIFHALSADPDVKDVSVTNPDPGEVNVYLLTHSGNGEAGDDLVDTVEAALSAADVRPLTDMVTVQSAEIIEYNIEAELTLYPGPDSEVVRQSAVDAVTAHTIDIHRVGLDVSLSGLLAQLHQPGVQDVLLTQPTENIVIDDTQAAYCVTITVTVNPDRDE